MDAGWARRVLAGLWILDGLLQLLPRMFTMFMVQSVLRPPTIGEPAWLAHLTQAIINGGSDHLVAFNAAIAAIQVGLGIALLLWRGKRAWPYWLSLTWCAGVWVFGEALGGLLTGQASLITGAPGSVVLYAALTWAAWPQLHHTAGKRRRAGVTAALGGLWALGAALQLQPAFFRGAGWAELLLGNVNPYQPHFVNAWMRWGAAALAVHPGPVNALWIALMAATAVGIWVGGGARRIALAGSIAMSVALWVFGQAFGMLLMAMATDPNSAPLFVALALYAWPGGPQAPRTDLNKVPPTWALRVRVVIGLGVRGGSSDGQLLPRTEIRRCWPGRSQTRRAFRSSLPLHFR